MKKVFISVFDGDLIKLDSGAELAKVDDSAFDQATKTGDWLSRLQLMTSNSEKCKRGEFPANHYAMVDGSNVIDLGESVDVLLITWRPKAIEMGDEIITVYDHEHDEFARISAKAGEKDSGCMFGPEFLVWVPSQGKYATFFMGSKSSRREAPNVKALLKNAATLKSHLIETKKHSWQSPCVSPCSTAFDLPEMDSLNEEAKKFVSEKAVETTTADEAETDATTRER